MKLELYFDRRTVVAAFCGTFIGVVLGACLAPGLHPFFYGDDKPDFAAVWTMRWNAALVFLALASLIAASLAALFAKRGVDTVLATERIKRTEEQIRRFERDLQTQYSGRVVPGQGGWGRRQADTAAMIDTKAALEEMLALLNYLAWVVDLSEHRLLNEDLYFDRLGPAVIMIYVALTPLLQQMRDQRIANLQTLRPFVVRAYHHSCPGYGAQQY